MNILDGFFKDDNSKKTNFDTLLKEIRTNDNSPIQFEELFFYYENKPENLELVESQDNNFFNSKGVEENYQFSKYLLFKDKETKDWANSKDRLNIDYFDGKLNENIFLTETKSLEKVYYDDIKKNIFSADSYTNYVKNLYFKFYNKKEKTYATGLIGMIVNKMEMIKLINNADRNLTVIYPRKEETTDNKVYGIIPCTNYLDYFYKFAFAIDEKLLKEIMEDKISYSSDTIIKMHQWKSFDLGVIVNQTFANLKGVNKFYKTNDENLEQWTNPNETLLINYHFLREILYMGFFMTSAVRYNFNETFGNIYYEEFANKIDVPKYIIKDQKDLFCKFGPGCNSTKILLDKTDQDIDISNLVFDFCKYEKHSKTVNHTFPYSQAFLDDVNKTIENEISIEEKEALKMEEEDDLFTQNVHNLKYFNLFQTQFKLFVAGNEENEDINSLGNKSFWTYISNINGLKMIFFEMLNFENYINLRVSFKEEIGKHFNLIYYLTLTTAVLFYFIIIHVSLNFVNYSTKKLMAIKVINENLFYYSIAINYLNKSEYFLEGPIESNMIAFIKDCHEKNIRKADIMKLEDNDIDFLKTNIYMSVKYKRKLVNIIRCVLNGK